MCYVGRGHYQGEKKFIFQKIAPVFFLLFFSPELVIYFLFSEKSISNCYFLLILRFLLTTRAFLQTLVERFKCDWKYWFSKKNKIPSFVENVKYLSVELLKIS